MFVPFGPWEPDTADLNGGAIHDIANVIPAKGSYIPFPAFLAFTDALPATPLSGIYARDSDASVHIFAGTATGIYKLNGTSWDDVTRTSGGDYSASSSAPWDFAQFGDFVIATNVNDDVQVYELGVSGDFSALSGSPPRSNYVRVWGDFLALMNQTSDATKVSWCDTNDITNWSTGVSGSQIFPDGGVIQGSTNATNPILFLENAIFYGTFIPGSSVAFTFTKLQDGIGAKSPYSIVSRGDYTFFADSGGFFQVLTSGQILPIGSEKVDRTAFGQLTFAEIQKIRGVIDPFFTRVYFGADFSGAGNIDQIYIYDWALGQWSRVERSILFHFPAATPGYTLEQLDNISASTEDLPFSLDSRVWQGGGGVLGAFDSDNKLGFFNGSSMEATLTTQEAGDTGGRMSTIRSVYPVIDASSSYVSIASRHGRSDSFSWSTEAVPSPNTGIARKRSRGKFHRVKVRIPAGDNWTHSQGVDVDSIITGRR